MKLWLVLFGVREEGMWPLGIYDTEEAATARKELYEKRHIMWGNFIWVEIEELELNQDIIPDTSYEVENRHYRYHDSFAV